MTHTISSCCCFSLSSLSLPPSLPPSLPLPPPPPPSPFLPYYALSLLFFSLSLFLSSGHTSGHHGRRPGRRLPGPGHGRRQRQTPGWTCGPIRPGRVSAGPSGGNARTCWCAFCSQDCTASRLRAGVLTVRASGCTAKSRPAALSGMPDKLAPVCH